MSDKRRRVLRWTMLVAFIAFVGFGWFRGEMKIVRTKAVNICLECIGIG